MYELGLTKNKKWQDKLRNELKSNFGTTKGTFPNKESIKNLPSWPNAPVIKILLFKKHLN